MPVTEKHSKTIAEIQEQADRTQDLFLEELKDLRYNQAKYGVIANTRGGIVLRLDNSQFPSRKRKLVP